MTKLSDQQIASIVNALHNAYMEQYPEEVAQLDKQFDDLNDMLFGSNKQSRGLRAQVGIIDDARIKE